MAKKLAKRNPPKKQVPAEEEPLALCPAPAEAEEVVIDTYVPHQKMPAGEIPRTCGKCGNISTVYVDDPDSYDDKARQKLYRLRGSSYQPPVCRWCVARLPQAERERLLA